MTMSRFYEKVAFILVFLSSKTMFACTRCGCYGFVNISFNPVMLDIAVVNLAISESFRSIALCGDVYRLTIGIYAPGIHGARSRSGCLFVSFTTTIFPVDGCIIAIDAVSIKSRGKNWLSGIGGDDRSDR